MEGLFTLENIEKAYRACRRRKRGTINALRFEHRLLDNLCDLRDELVSRTYHPSSSICFIQRRPKLREIFAADFRDRVIHHLLVGYLEPVFEKIFIYDSYSCRKDKGVHAAVKRLRSFLHKVTQNGTKKAGYMQADISGFFMNVDKDILYELIRRKVKREDVRWLARVVIYHDCTADYRFKGNHSLLERIPPHKTLFKVSRDRGLPIGNLSSQFFANVYLNELDQFVKRRLGCRFYIRYCDDLLFLSSSSDQLAEWRMRIEEFLKERLHLNLNHSQDKLRPVSSGINFLGYVVRRSHVLVRRRVVNHFHEKLDSFERRLIKEKKGEPFVWEYPPYVMQKLRATTASYIGHFSWADSYSLVRGAFANRLILRAAFMLINGNIFPRYLEEKDTGNIRLCYRYWVPDARAINGYENEKIFYPLWAGEGRNINVLVFFPVGCFYEFYGSQADVAQSVLGLRCMTGLRGFRVGCGFHRRHLGKFLHMALNKGYHVALICAQKNVEGKIIRRLARLFRAEPGFEADVCEPA